MMKRVRVVVALALTLGTAVLAGGCEGSDDMAEPDASVTPDASAPSSVDSGAAPDVLSVPDAPPTTSEGNSNLPGVVWEAGPTSEPGLVVVSSNFTQEDLGGTVFNHWYAELLNRGTSIECYAHVVLELEDASGSSLATLESYADARAYESTSGNPVSMPCLAPGEHAAFYDINQVSAEVDTTTLRRAVYTIDTLVRNDAVPSALAPTLLGASVISKLDGWALAGSARADGGTIYNLAMDVYTVGPSGLITDQVSDFHHDTLLQGSTWDYETSANGGESIRRYLQFISFIDGAHAKRTVAEDPHALALRSFRERRAQVRARRDTRSAE
jgi:hypothetical protein